MKFKKQFILLLLIAGSLHSFCYSQGNNTPVDLADPLIDTHRPRFDYFILK